MERRAAGHDPARQEAQGCLMLGSIPGCMHHLSPSLSSTGWRKDRPGLDARIAPRNPERLLSRPSGTLSSIGWRRGMGRGASWAETGRGGAPVREKEVREKKVRERCAESPLASRSCGPPIPLLRSERRRGCPKGAPQERRPARKVMKQFH